MTQTQAWLLQAQSDLKTAIAVTKEHDASTYCQGLSKYQQVVEKSAKAVVSAVRESGVSFNPVTRDHDPSRQIEALLASRRALNQKHLEYIKRMFTEKRITEIRRLCSLAPHYPKSEERFARNTEYPYQDALGNWTAPASPNSFIIKDVQEAHQLAWLLINQASRFTEVMRLRN